MRIQGNLATYEFSDLLQWLAQGNKTGVLTVSDGEAEYQLGFDQGRIDMSSSSDPEQRLEAYLHRQGIIDEITVARAGRLRDATKMMSGQVLVTLGAVSEEQLAQALREKTEEILCELLTWERGTFEFDGGDRSPVAMVPINLEVTKLLLESMHRLDQRRGGPAAERPRPAMSFKVDAGGSLAAGTAPADATQAIEGLALAEVLDPERPPQPVATSPATPRRAPSPGAVEMPLDADLPPHYAAMVQGPGRFRRLAPYALAAVLSLTAAGFYLANREAAAEAADVGPAGKPILFTPTPGPLTPPAAVPAGAPAAPAAPVDAAPAGQGESAGERALRLRYERQLEELRRELADARRESGPPSARPAPAVGSRAELPANSMMRAAVSRDEADGSPAVVSSQLEPARPELRPAAETAGPASPLAAPAVADLPAPWVAEPGAIETPATGYPAAGLPASGLPASETAPQEPQPTGSGEAAGRPLAIVNPQLVDRPAPRYPLAALRHGRGATLVLRVLVGKDGRVDEIKRVGPKAGLGFDRAAEEAAMASSWEPATRDGEPIPMWAELRFEFKP